MSNIKVSVIIPMYNAARFIESSINALLDQTLKDIEILVMDDCSPDNSADIVNSVYADCDRVRYVKMAVNGGPGKARNRGIELAEGEYVTFLDADDGIVPEALERLYNAAVKFDADVVQSAGAYVPAMFPTPDNIMLTPDDKMVASYKDADTREPMLISDDMNERIQGLMAGKLGGNVWGKIFKKSFLVENNINMPDLKLSEDTIMCLECLVKAKRYVVTPYFSIIYRMIGDSLSKGTKTIAFMHKTLDATFGGDIIVSDILKEQEYFRDKPDEVSNIIKWMDQAMEFCYIRPCYQQLDRAAMETDESLNALFDKYFGGLASYVKSQFYQNHDALPAIPDVFANDLAYQGLLKQLEDRGTAPLP